MDSVISSSDNNNQTSGKTETLDTSNNALKNNDNENFPLFSENFSQESNLIVGSLDGYEDSPEYTEREDFNSLLNNSLDLERKERTVVKGKIIAITKDNVNIDVGVKAPGMIPIGQFEDSMDELSIGNEIYVYLEKFEGSNGSAVLSREKAIREMMWDKLVELHEKSINVPGRIFGKIKGGFMVNIEVENRKLSAFLPGSQLDIRPIHDISHLLDETQPFRIVKMLRDQSSIVISRRVVMENATSKEREDVLATMKVGMTLQGVIKNITNYGAFVSLGQIDGLLHITDITWGRMSHPSEALELGQSVEVKVIKFHPEYKRVSLGMKQLTPDPWLNVAKKYQKGKKVTGKVTNIVDYGAFVQLEPGVEALIHVSEMSWGKSPTRPSKILSTSQEIEVMILDVDSQRRRIALGIRQLYENNPWEAFCAKHKTGDVITGEIRNIVSFGLFVNLGAEAMDGLVHISDLSWENPGSEALEKYTKNDSIEVKVLSLNGERGKVTLGVKQLHPNPGIEVFNTFAEDQTITCEIITIYDDGIEVKLPGSTVLSYIKRCDLVVPNSNAAEKVNLESLYSVNSDIELMIKSIDKENTKLLLMTPELYEIAKKKELESDSNSKDTTTAVTKNSEEKSEESVDEPETPEDQEEDK